MTRRRTPPQGCRIYRQSDEVVCGLCRLRYTVGDDEKPACPVTKEPMA